jgi:hypothetical protein
MGILVSIHAQGDLRFCAHTVGYLHVYFLPEIEGQQLVRSPENRDKADTTATRPSLCKALSYKVTLGSVRR